MLSTPEHPVGRRVVARIMRKNGWKSKVVKKYKATTNSKHNMPVAENLLNCGFAADRPNQKWVNDITYVPTDEGGLYVASILDLCGREEVSWAMGERITKNSYSTLSGKPKGGVGTQKTSRRIRIEEDNTANMIIKKSWQRKDLSAP